MNNKDGYMKMNIINGSNQQRIPTYPPSWYGNSNTIQPHDVQAPSNSQEVTPNPPDANLVEACPPHKKLLQFRPMLILWKTCPPHKKLLQFRPMLILWKTCPPHKRLQSQRIRRRFHSPPKFGPLCIQKCFSIGFNRYVIATSPYINSWNIVSICIYLFYCDQGYESCSDCFIANESGLLPNDKACTCSYDCLISSSAMALLLIMQ